MDTQVDELVLLRDETRHVREELSRLKPDEHRALLLLDYGYGYTYRETPAK